MPRPGEVLGLVGTNGIGKSTALKILSGKMKPNLGRFVVSKIYFTYFCKFSVKILRIDFRVSVLIGQKAEQ
jgi:translation initiation factor RLI1